MKSPVADFPPGRPTLICGGAGCGKTLLGTEFLVRGAQQYNEPGVLMAFEETAQELAVNVRSLGFDLDRLIAEKKLLIDHVRVERSEIEETGEYDLEGLFIRLGHAIDSIGAKRVVLDTLEALFSGLNNSALLRAELRRLFRWLKDRGVTAIITAERGEGMLTRHGLEEYVLRLRHRARSSRQRTALNAAFADCQVSRFRSRNQRVSVPHRRDGLLSLADYFGKTGTRRAIRTDFNWDS